MWLACSHKSHRRCFFLFSDTFSRTRTQRGGLPRPNLLQLQHERRYADPFSRRPTCGGSFTYYRVSPHLASRRYDASALRIAFGSSTFLLFRRPTTTVRRTAPIMQTRRRICSFFFLRMHARNGREEGVRLITEDAPRESKFSVGFPRNDIVTQSKSEKFFYAANIKHPRTSEIFRVA